MEWNMAAAGVRNRTNNGFEKMLVGINARSIDFAKLGRLFLMNSISNGKQKSVSKHWIQEATQPGEKPPSYYQDDPWFIPGGHYINISGGGTKELVSINDFHAAGNKGQYIRISPRKKISLSFVTE